MGKKLDSIWLWHQHPTSKDGRRALIIANENMVIQVFKLKTSGGKHWPQPGDLMSDWKARCGKDLKLQELTTTQAFGWAKWGITKKIAFELCSLLISDRIQKLPLTKIMHEPENKTLWYFVQVRGKHYRATVLISDNLNGNVTQAYEFGADDTIQPLDFKQTMTVEELQSKCEQSPSGQLWQLRAIGPERALNIAIDFNKRFSTNTKSNIKGKNLLRFLLKLVNEDIRED